METAGNTVSEIVPMTKLTMSAGGFGRRSRF